MPRGATLPCNTQRLTVHFVYGPAFSGAVIVVAICTLPVLLPIPYYLLPFARAVYYGSHDAVT